MPSSFAAGPAQRPDPTAPRGRVLINGLSIGSGGGYTVGWELFRHLAAARPGGTVTLALTAGHPLHEEARRAPDRPANARLHWAPPGTGGRLARARYERGGLARWAAAEGVTAVVQLNGMLVPGMPAPTLCHYQDPMPYRPEAWRGPRDRAAGWLKRRAHAGALRSAAALGFTSRYLQDLICDHHRVAPGRRGRVYYNGLPDAWVDRAAGHQGGGPPAAAWADRPPELVSVSNVAPYKRHDLVIRALPALAAMPGLERVTYRVIGHGPPAYLAELARLAADLRVGDRVAFEGRVPDARVAEALGSARAFVLMSVCESFGIPAVEAMSFGTPVVTSDCCAMPEVCGGAADLVPPDDLPALTAALATALTDPAHADRLRRLGAARVGRFRWAATAAAMADELDRIGAVAR